MYLKNISYDKEYRNLLIDYFEFKKNNEIDDDIKKKYDKFSHILTYGLISEYHKIEIQLSDSAYDEVGMETSTQVRKILRTYFELEAVLELHYPNKKNDVAFDDLKFEGFNDHDDGNDDSGQIDFAEYLIDFEDNFSLFKGIVSNGDNMSMSKYIKVINFFKDKEINKETIDEYINKKVHI